MIRVRLLWFFLAVFWINFVFCEILCEIEDHECVTKGANSSYGPFVNGADNLVEASDPLRRELIKADLPTLKYQLMNASLIGMKDCEITRLKIDRNESSFEFYLECPSITINSEYEVKGNLAALYVEGKGSCTISCDDYVFMFSGNFEKHIGVDNQPHVQLTKYTVDGEAIGHVAFDFQNLFDGDKEKSEAAHKFVNENWRGIDEMLRVPTLNSFMEVFMDNLNTFLKVVPVENVLSSDD